ncbi:hypothetical protein ACFL9S_07240 [Erwinia sp. AnSW2-5]|uniref:hypothetical protein n=1 Tax=Erwinia sp. AnSW2-5 TaxID=3367692 RepID=UPI00385D195D
MRELSTKEMNVVAGGFSIGSCSIGGGYSHSENGKGGSSTSFSVHATCGVNAPDSATSQGGKNSSGKSNNGKSSSSQRGGGKNR